jgi:hypothetical protein
MVLDHLDTRPVIDMNTVRLGGNPTALFDGSRLAFTQKQKAKASKKLTRLSAYFGCFQIGIRRIDPDPDPSFGRDFFEAFQQLLVLR